MRLFYSLYCQTSTFTQKALNVMRQGREYINSSSRMRIILQYLHFPIVWSNTEQHYSLSTKTIRACMSMPSTEPAPSCARGDAEQLPCQWQSGHSSQELSTGQTTWPTLSVPEHNILKTKGKDILIYLRNPPLTLFSLSLFIRIHDTPHLNFMHKT